jgi:hypothetical protein
MMKRLSPLSISFLKKLFESGAPFWLHLPKRRGQRTQAGCASGGGNLRLAFARNDDRTGVVDKPTFHPAFVRRTLRPATDLMALNRPPEWQRSERDLMHIHAVE